MNQSQKEGINNQIENADYRGAVESLLEIMKGIADERGNTPLVEEIEEIASKVFDIPNINWQKE